MSDLLNEEQIEGIYQTLCAAMYIDEDDRHSTYERQTPEEQKAMDDTESIIKQLIAKSKLTLSADNESVVYRLLRPIKTNNSETQEVSFSVDSLSVEKLMKAQSKPNLSDAEKGRQLLALATGLSLLQIDKMLTKDYQKLQMVLGFFMAA
ncbi:phage tail assembly protein (plasmid) [Entomospira nematocerorum]|uniref:Phage tail assembly protein n=1 Tax=Entomospira nematocerorum TaxID=2719987 RepID=A0A968GDH4_9SPIO|nr:phage tail assembly protein [Entomospira nematocera]NIZ47774.1 hypothetical protein [Entomospira nematocera]WDI34728.1 phage tail assembly protein [Entomospira nematocera]